MGYNSEVLNIGHTAFIDSNNKSGVIYAMYELLESWTGFSAESTYLNGPYKTQKLVIIEIDLKNKTATKIGQYIGDPGVAPNGSSYFSDLNYSEVNRVKKFSFYHNASEGKLQILDDSQVLLSVNVPKF